MNKKEYKESKKAPETNYRVIIKKSGNRVNDGRGLAIDQAEAVKMFKSVLSRCTGVISAELYYKEKDKPEKLLKKV